MNKNYMYVFLLLSFFGYSQITDLVEPRSWNNNFSDETIEMVSIPFEELARYMEEDLNAAQQSLAKPYRFGARLQTNVTRQTHGETITLENDDVIWRVGFESEGAKTLNFLIRNYNLAEGAELVIYNADRSMKMGPYTSNENNEINEITTWPIDGSKVYMEFFEPSGVVGQSSFTISELVHGYRTVTKEEVTVRALNSSGPCNIDADCPLGDNFTLQKKAVVMLVTGANGFCSGTLVNNTAEDKKPYILTANHCGAGPGQEVPVNSVRSWAFRFNWISPNPVCADPLGTPSTDGPFLQTVNGATVKASAGLADMLLMEVNNPIPATWDVVFAGWSRSTTAPSFTTGIHHPSGDIMKICRDNNSPSRTNLFFNGFSGTQVWFINGGGGGGWEQGVTEPGSSGSQLLDSNGLLIGVLSGGSAACNGNSDNGGVDYYGRLDAGWFTVGNFLDPNPGNLAMTVGHLQNVLSVDSFNLTEYIEIYPNPSNGIIYFKSALQTNEKVDYILTDVQGKFIERSTIDLTFNAESEIHLKNVNPGIYFLRFQSDNINEVKKIVIN